MDLLIKKSDIKSKSAVFSAPYCSLSNPRLLDAFIRLGYSVDSYGCACSYWLVASETRQVVICEGYRPISSVTKRAQREFDALAKKYSEKAKKIGYHADEKAYKRLARAFKREVLKISHWEE